MIFFNKKDLNQFDTYLLKSDKHGVDGMGTNFRPEIHV